jgi:hypothetical protein
VSARVLGIAAVLGLMVACSSSKYATDLGGEGRLLGFRGSGSSVTMTASTENAKDVTLRWWWWVVGPDYSLALASAEGQGKRDVRIELPPGSAKRGDALHFRVMFFGADGSETGQLETEIGITR